MLYNWQDMKNFIEQILIKFGSFYVIKMNFVQTMPSTSIINIGGNSYRPIFKRSKHHR